MPRRRESQGAKASSDGGGKGKGRAHGGRDGDKGAGKGRGGQHEHACDVLTWQCERAVLAAVRPVGGARPLELELHCSKDPKCVRRRARAQACMRVCLSMCVFGHVGLCKHAQLKGKLGLLRMEGAHAG